MFVCFWRDSPKCARASSFTRFLGHTTTHNRRYDYSGRVISPTQRPLPDNIQHSQQTNTHAPGGIRTHNLSRRAAAHLRHRPRGHCYHHQRSLFVFWRDSRLWARASSFTRFQYHTQRRTTVDRTPLDE